MSKTYKGYELIKAIADGEIKEDTKFREMVENRYYIFKDRELWEQEDTGIYNSKLENLQIIYGAFELIEDEIDIDNIEELDKCKFEHGNTISYQESEFIDKVNELVQVVKQLNKEIKELKSKEYCQVCGVELTEKNKYMKGMCYDCKYGEE